MKSNNANTMKWMRAVSGLLAIVFLTFGSAGQASARILFEDDEYFKVQSEGIVLDENDNAVDDTDVIEIKFGNDGTDATFTYTPSAVAANEDLTIDVPGNDIDFSDDTLTTTGEIRFEGSSHFRMREAAFAAYSGAAAPDCDYVGEVALDTNTDAIYVCTVTGAPGGTWVSADNNPPAGAADSQTLRWDAATSTWEANSNLTVDDAATAVAVANGTSFTANGSVTLGDGGDAVDINGTTGNWDLTDLDFDIAGNPSEITLTSDGAGDDLTIEVAGATDSSLVLQSTGTGADAIDMNASAGGVTVDASSGISLDAGAASNFTTSAGAITVDGASGINLQGNASEIDVTTTGALDMNSGAFTLDGSTVSIDGTDDSNFTVTANDAAAKTLTLSATNAGAGDGDIAVTADDDIGLTATAGDITFTDVNDSLTFSQTSAGMGNDLLNGAGEIFEATGSIGSTIGGGETSTSLIHAINAVGTYATALGAGANDNIDDVYNNSVSDATFQMEIDNANGLAFNISGVGGSFTIEDGDDPVFTVANTGAVTIDGNAASTFQTSAGDITIDSQAASVNIDGGEAVANAVWINASNAAGGIDMDAGTGGVAIDTTGAFSLDGAGTASNISLASDGAGDDLTVEVTGANDSSLILQSAGTGTDAVRINASNAAGDIDIDAGDAITMDTANGDITFTAGDDMIFSDAQIGANIVQLSAADNDWDADFATDGIVDNINDIATQLGGDSISTFNFTEDNVLADNDAVYAALDKLDLKWGDLASTANGEGASLVGIEDAGGYTAETDVEGALQEIYGQIGSNAFEVEDLTFYPEYPDATVYPDGANNKGTLEAFYDNAQTTNYYNWTTTKGGATQDINIHFEFPLPTDFDSVGANGFQFAYRTGNGVGASDVDVTFINQTDGVTCGSSLNNDNGTGAGGAFGVGQITQATLEGVAQPCDPAGANPLDPGDIIRIEIQLATDNNANDFADVGYLTLDYDN